jgi:hypothetical protein
VILNDVYISGPTLTGTATYGQETNNRNVEYFQCDESSILNLVPAHSVGQGCPTHSLIEGYKPIKRQTNWSNGLVLFDFSLNLF